MYEKALILHSLLRLVAVLALFWAVGRAFHAWRCRLPFTRADKSASFVLAFVLDLQIALGALLYFAWSPAVQNARADFGAAMHTPELRRWAVEHPATMLLAIALVHITKVCGGRAKTDAARHRRLLIGYWIALLIVLAQSPWPFNAYARPWLHVFG